MESTTINNEIKEGRELFNEIRGSLSRRKKAELEKNFIKKVYLIF